MTILVTGGAGFIGSHTVDALVAAGRDVCVLDDLSAGTREQVNPRARLHQADVRDRGAVQRIIEEEKPDTIFHLAAQMDVRRSVADPVFDAEVNLIGLLNLMESGRRNGLKRVIFASSGGAIYGEQDAFPCDEEHPCRPVSPYGVAKLASERYLFFYHVQYGIECTAMRYANVYGPRQDPHGEAGVVAIFCGRFLEGKPVTIFGDGEQTRDYVFVGDVAAANLAALSRGSGTFNIGTGVETRVTQLFAELASIAERRKPIHAPARPGEQRRSVISAALAARELGWRPEVTLKDGLSRTLAFFRGSAAPPKRMLS